MQVRFLPGAPKSGELTTTDEDVLWEIYFGPAEFMFAEVGDVEIVTNAIETIYHGTAEALITHGIDRDRLPLGKRPAKSQTMFNYNQPLWWSRLQLDDAIVHRV